MKGALMKLRETANNVRTKEDFADFIGELRVSLATDRSAWENPSLERFLEAVESWTREIDTYARNTGDSDVPIPSWQTFAKIMCAAKVYE